MSKARDTIKSKVRQMKDAVFSGQEINPSELLQFQEEEIMPEYNTRGMRGLPTSTTPIRVCYRGDGGIVLLPGWP